MKKIIYTIAFSLLIIWSAQSQVVFEEDFQGNTIPSGWTINSQATDGGWNVGTQNSLSSQSFVIPSNGSSRVAATNDDKCNCNKKDEYFFTPAIDLSNVSAAVLKFDAFYLDNSYNGVNEDATIEISLDGLTWELLNDLEGNASWYTHILDLTKYVGETSVYIGFRYNDNNSWLYGFAIDNVIVEVPPLKEVEMASLNSTSYGEVGTDITISGVVFNGGSLPINTLEIAYTIDDQNQVVELLENLDIPAFTNFDFKLENSWKPDALGDFKITVEVLTVNGEGDGTTDNNSDSFNSRIFEKITIPNRIQDILDSDPIINEISAAASFLNKPSDLDFFPILGKDELWITNQRTEAGGGSTLTISDATSEDNLSYLHRVDGNAWHFMSIPTAIAFSDDNFNFATGAGVQDANHNGGTFTGPTLWSSHPDIYAKPSGGNGSHLDMLHGSPYSMGIAHEIDNVFWVYDNWNKDIVRYDFAEDHGPGNDYHGDAIVRRFKNMGINGDGNIPNHMILDKSTGWLYFVDNGKDRVIRLNINTGNNSPIAEINESLAEHSQVKNYDFEVIIESGLDRPCGIEILDNRLLVGDYATGDIIVYDMDNDFQEMGRMVTGFEGLTGIKVGPKGNVWYTNRIENTVHKLEPGNASSVEELRELAGFEITPNLTSGIITIKTNGLDLNLDAAVQIFNIAGEQVWQFKSVIDGQQLDLSPLTNGIYFVELRTKSHVSTEKLILNK